LAASGPLLADSKPTLETEDARTVIKPHVIDMDRSGLSASACMELWLRMPGQFAGGEATE
jgi:hypothetical protein